MFVVLDTNVLVSALWSKNGAAAQVMSMVLNGSLTPCYDYRILTEYRDVLKCPKFRFTNGEINALLDWIEMSGKSVLAEPAAGTFPDESDRKFYEVAKCCRAVLITGNLKHFPEEPFILSVHDFLEKTLPKK